MTPVELDEPEPDVDPVLVEPAPAVSAVLVPVVPVVLVPVVLGSVVLVPVVPVPPEVVGVPAVWPPNAWSRSSSAVWIWFNKFANRSLPWLDVPEAGVGDDELGVEEEGVVEPPDESTSSEIDKLSSVIVVVPALPLTAFDVDELGADPTP